MENASVMFLWETGWMIMLTGNGIGCAPGFGHMVNTHLVVLLVLDTW
jgi:hypothetical protein